MRNDVTAWVVLILIQILRPVVFFLMPIILLFAKSTTQETTHYGQPPIKRYRLPKWLSVFETPDEHLPGGLYEPTVFKMYEKWGWFITSWYWIGLRNVLHGWQWRFGIEIPKKMRDLTQSERDMFRIWEKEYVVGPIKFLFGWRSKNDHYLSYTKSGHFAVPRFSVRLNKQD